MTNEEWDMKKGQKIQDQMTDWLNTDRRTMFALNKIIAKALTQAREEGYQTGLNGEEVKGLVDLIQEISWIKVEEIKKECLGYVLGNRVGQLKESLATFNAAKSKSEQKEKKGGPKKDSHEKE